MSCCNRGCEPCHSIYVNTGQHSYECCGGSACYGSRSERQEAQRLRERTVANQRADEVAKKTNDLVAKMQELAIAVATAELQMKAMQQVKEESAMDQLRRLAQQQEDEEEAEKTRAAIEARLTELKDRQQDAQVSKEPEPEKPREQKPKVVHVKAANTGPAVARQKVAQHGR